MKYQVGKSWFGPLLFCSAMFSGVMAFCFAAWCLALMSTPIRLYEGKGYSRITFDKNSQLLDMQIAPDGRYRSPVAPSRVPQSCVDAAVQFEDKYFYSHPGVNPISMLRALVSTLGEKRVGGSTLTMQLVRLREGYNTKTPRGKLRQMWDAFVLERHYDKKEILQAYFTFAPYGGGIEGLAAASAIYFGKPPEDLSRAECAGLAVLPQAPSSRFAFQGQEFRNAFLRLGEKLQLPAHEQAINFPPRATIDPPHYARHLTSRVLSSGGVVQTTLHRPLQQAFERLVADYVRSHLGLGLQNAALVLADGQTGEVLAYVASKDYSDVSIKGFVDGIQAKRSPGSLLKPFVYAKAIEEGVIVPDSVIADVPIKLTSYEPENFERNFLGLISVREALVKSRNIPALLLNTQLKEDGLFTLLDNAGVFLGHDAQHYGSAVVLGGIEISLLDAVRLYTSFVSRGQAIPLRMTKMPAAQKPVQLFSPESAYLTRQMLASNPAPPGYSSRSVAWKTGTSSGGRDAWAVGVMGSLVTGVWLGNFDGSPNPNFVGRDLAGPLLFRAIELLRQNPEFSLLAAIDMSGNKLSLVHAHLCPESGMIRGTHCPHVKRGWVIPGVSPIKTCTMHRDGTGGEIVYSSDVTMHLENAGLQLSEKSRPVSRAAKDPPRITSPEEGVEYRVMYGQNAEIEFSASLDGEAEKVYWYVDGSFVGESLSGRSFFWKAEPGTFTIRAMDTFGASDAKAIKVRVQEG